MMHAHCVFAKVGLEEPINITDKNGKVLKQVKNFRYLGSVFHATHSWM